MPRTRIKICGVKTIEAALAAAAAGADAVGLVFVERSPRFVTIEQATTIVAQLPAWVSAIGLFVNENAMTIRDVAGQVGLHGVQLHGDEPPEDVEKLRPLSVIKALPAGSDIAGWARVNAVLLDTPPPPEAGALPGGSGRAFDWSAIELPEDAPPLILAGGLTPDNVADAIAAVRPYGVDVSSGVESSRSVKSVEKIAAFCEAVRTADRP